MIRKWLIRYIAVGILMLFTGCVYTAPVDGIEKATNATAIATTQIPESTALTQPISADLDIMPANGRVIYLTFDDGPSGYTENLLDILDAYQVKATFFVAETSYLHLLDDIVQRGHTVGIHSASHVYRDIYASEEAFFADLTRMRDIIYQQTGVYTNLMRFPGGSSNTVSCFNPGIMTRLTRAVEDMGYCYFDWNVDSADAGGAATAREVAENVIRGCEKLQVAVVLQHDTKGYSVEAVEQIIRWGMENGYTFQALSEWCPAVHHSVAN